MYNYLIFDILVTCLDFYEMKHYSNNEIKKERKGKDIQMKMTAYIVCTIQNFHGSNHRIIPMGI